MEYLGVRGFHRALVPNVCLREHAAGDVPVPSALKDDLVAAAKGEEYRVLSQVDLARFILAHEGRFGLALAQRSGPSSGCTCGTRGTAQDPPRFCQAARGAAGKSTRAHICQRGPQRAPGAVSCQQGPKVHHQGRHGWLSA